MRLILGNTGEARCSRHGLLVCVLLSGCSRSSERRSDEAITEAGAWNRAYATVKYGRSFHDNGREYPAHVLHALTVTRPDDHNQLYVILTQRTEPETPPTLFDELQKTVYALQWAPDGHALAASTDAGRAWTIFDFTAATKPLTVPFYCPHQSFGALDPWPDVRAQVLEVLHETHPSSDAHVHDAPVDATQPMSENGGELLDAALYACAKRNEDPELREALLDAFVSPWNGAIASRGGDDSALPSCIGDLGRRDPAVRRRLSSAVPELTDFSDKGRVESGLYFVDHGDE